MKHCCVHCFSFSVFLLFFVCLIPMNASSVRSTLGQVPALGAGIALWQSIGLVIDQK